MGPIKPGDRFFSVRSNRRPREAWIVVTKVGRRWADYVTDGYEAAPHFGGRFDIETLRIDGGRFSSPGRVYRTEDEYREQARLSVIWQAFRTKVDRSYQPPDKVGVVDILKAADALRFRLKEE